VGAVIVGVPGVVVAEGRRCEAISLQEGVVAGNRRCQGTSLPRVIVAGGRRCKRASLQGLPRALYRTECRLEPSLLSWAVPVFAA
jgi:hypothetical protein